MTRIVTCGFEHRVLAYDYPSAAEYWDTGTLGRNWVGGRNQGTAYQVSNYGWVSTRFYALVDTFPGGPYDELFIQFNLANESASKTLSIRDASNQYLLDTGGDYTNPTVIVAGQVVGQLGAMNGWRFVQIHMKVAAEGFCRIWVEGAKKVDFTGNTNPNGYGLMHNFVHWIYAPHNSMRYLHLDNVIVNTPAGSADNDFPGETEIVRLAPNGTASAGLLGSDGNSVDNHLLVDEQPPAGTDYVIADAPGETDVYYLATYEGAGSAIRAVYPYTVHQQADPTNDLQARVGVEVGGNALWNSPFYADKDGGWSMHSYALTLNPETGQAWTQSEIDALRVMIGRAP